MHRHQPDWQPEREVEIVAGTPAGGGQDRPARALIKVLQQASLGGVSFKVTNIPGLGGGNAWRYLARQAGDAHVLAISSPTLLTNQLLGEDALDFQTLTPLANLYTEYIAFLVRGDSLSSTMSQYLIDQIKETPNIQLWTHASVAEVHGETHLEEISVLCSDTNKTERVPASAMFIFIGALPRTDWLAGMIERDERGFILTGPDLMHGGQRPKGWALDRDPFLLETNIPGIFAVGDVRHGSVKRVASGVGEGSVAVQFIHQYLSKV